MKSRIQAKPLAPKTSPAIAPPISLRSRSGFPGRDEAKAVESGLLRLCEEIAGTLLRRRLESRDPVASVREMRRDLVAHLPDCDETRAGHLVDLSLELLHVKARGRFRRNPLELSELIARAARQLRDPADN